MFTKYDVTFPAEGGIELAAWLFLPKRSDGKAPGIIITEATSVTPQRVGYPTLPAPGRTRRLPTGGA